MTAMSPIFDAGGLASFLRGWAVGTAITFIRLFLLDGSVAGSCSTFLYHYVIGIWMRSLCCRPPFGSGLFLRRILWFRLILNHTHHFPSHITLKNNLRLFHNHNP